MGSSRKTKDQHTARTRTSAFSAKMKATLLVLIAAMCALQAVGACKVGAKTPAGDMRTGKDCYALGGCTAACDTAKKQISGSDIKFTCSGCNIASKWYIIAFSIMAAFVMKTL